MRLRRTGRVFLALGLAALLAGFIEWPVPNAFRARILTEASRRLERPVAFDRIRWSPFRGVSFGGVRIGANHADHTDGASLYAPAVRVHDLLPWRATKFSVSSPEIRALRDAKGRLRVPWPELETFERPERISLSGGTVHYHDVPFGIRIDLVDVAGHLRPREKRGEIEASWGETDPVRFTAAWEDTRGRFDLRDLAASWELTHDASEIRVAFRPAEEGVPGLTGEILAGPGKFEAAARGRISGPVLDPFLDGTKISGTIDLDLAWVAPKGRLTARSRNGRISGVGAFRHLAARPGLERFRNPRYDLLEAEVSIRTGRMDVASSRFEGEGLGMRFSGVLTDRTASGTLVALFSEELAGTIPELAQKAPLLDREGDRIKVVYVVSGSRGAPHLEPVPPSAPKILWRGAGMILRRGIGAISSSVAGLGRIFSGEE